VRREDNLLAVRRRKFVVTTSSDHDFLVYPNLAQYMVLTAVNQLWVAGITYLRLASELVYFAVALDAFSILPLTALNRAIAQRSPSPGLVHHSDRGTRHASNDYVRRPEECQITISMSRPARPWENARCERFIRTLKEEEIDCTAYSTLQELERNLEDFIERYYSRLRLHAALGYHSPVEFEQQQVGIAVSPAATCIMAGLSFRRLRRSIPMSLKPSALTAKARVETGEKANPPSTRHSSEESPQYIPGGLPSGSGRIRPIQRYFPNRRSTRFRSGT
jgi:putative transposase